MRKIISSLSISSMILLASCTTPAYSVDPKQEVEKTLLQDIYTYQFNTIEPQHQKSIHEWLQQSRANHSKNHIYLYTIDNGDLKHGYKYMYVFGKGYQTIETAFMYSQDNNKNNNNTTIKRETENITDEGKGTLYIKGLKGKATDEVILCIQYNEEYVSSIGIVDRFFK